MVEIARRSSLNFGCFLRRMSTTAKPFKFIDIKNSNNGYSILEMKRKPVNSLNLEFNQELVQAINNLENDSSCRGVIITSQLPVFTAGLDITELFQPEPDRLKEFLRSTQDLHLKYFSSPLIMISAINGACPAGGCIFALSSDYRIFVDGRHTIGVNEVLLGLTPPWWFAQSLKLVVGQRQAEKLFSLGTLLKPKQALEIGLVDEVVSKDDLITVAENTMTKWLKIADVGRVQTKRLLRQKYIHEFNERRDEDMNMFIQRMLSKNVQTVLGKYFEALQKK